jgi:uncharacterized delta-60 repeat protein
VVLCEIVHGCGDAHDHLTDAGVVDSHGEDSQAPDATAECSYPGELDPSFGTNGVTRPIFGVADWSAAATSVRIEPNSGKILIAGSYRRRDKMFEECAVVRLTPDGVLDVTFGAGGIATVAIEQSDCWLEAIVLQADGKIVGVGGVNGQDTARTGLVRLDGDGALDTTFGDGGLVIGAPAVTGHAVGAAIDSDGKIVVAAQTWDGTEVDSDSFFSTFRYLSTGALDPGFGSGGVADAALAHGRDLAADIKVQADGKIVVVCVADGPSLLRTEFEAVRYMPDGTLDASFGMDGTLTVGFPEGNREATAVALASTGQPLMIGPAGGGSTATALVRLESNGSLDETFGAGGQVVSAAAANQGLVVSPIDQSIVAAGWQRDEASNTSNVVVARLTSSAELDPTFGTNGIATAASASPHTQAYDVAIQDDRKIVVVGTRLDYPDSLGVPMDFFAARFCP